MDAQKQATGRTARRKTSDLSRQPGERQAKAPKAPAGRGAKPGKALPAGPGGLGYVLALEEREIAEIEWRGEEHPAPPSPRQGR